MSRKRSTSTPSDSTITRGKTAMETWWNSTPTQQHIGQQNSKPGNFENNKNGNNHSGRNQNHQRNWNGSRTPQSSFKSGGFNGNNTENGNRGVSTTVAHPTIGRLRDINSKEAELARDVVTGMF